MQPADIRELRHMLNRTIAARQNMERAIADYEKKHSLLYHAMIGGELKSVSLGGYIVTCNPDAGQVTIEVNPDRKPGERKDRQP